MRQQSTESSLALLLRQTPAPEHSYITPFELWIRTRPDTKNQPTS